MTPHQEQHDGIHEAVRRALNEELPKALESALARLADQHTSQSETPALLSRKQAAHVLGVSLQTIATMIAEGTLQSVRVRRRVLVPPLVEYLERQSSTGLTGGGNV